MKQRVIYIILTLLLNTVPCHSQFNSIKDGYPDLASSNLPHPSPKHVFHRSSDSLRILEILSLYSSVAYPLDRMEISSPFGQRYHPIDKIRKKHNGIDLRADNDKVYAIRKGKVEKINYDKISGKYVIISQEDGAKVSYCHLSKILVKTGEEVTAGQVVAISGNTGKSTGPHLHLVVRLSGKCIDPYEYLQGIIRIREKAFADYIQIKNKDRHKKS